MSDSTILTAFHRIFQGDQNSYTIHAAPFTESEGKLKAKFCGFAVYGSKSFPRIPEGCEKGDHVPLTKNAYKEHLNGGNGLAVTPLCHTKNKNNVCYFAAIDIDVYGGVIFTGLVKRLYQVGFKFAACLSKSGGLHIYFFFGEAEPGDKVIEALNNIVNVFGLKRLYSNEKNKSKVEVFPKSSVLISGDKNVNGLFLPFYNSAKKGCCKNKLLTAEGKLLVIEQAIPVIEGMFTSVMEINDVLDNLPYSDAPYCIQSILLTGALAEGDFRNNFLFEAAKYLKRKYNDDFYSYLEGMNDCLQEPLEEKDLARTYK